MSTTNGLSHTQPIRRFEWQTPLLNLLIWAAWLWLFRPIFPYLSHIFTEDDFRTNQLLLVLLFGLVAHRLYESGTNLQLSTPLVVRPLPLWLTFGGAIGFLLNERFLDVNTVSASLFALGSYGVVGLWLPSRRWRRGLPVALLLVGTLPFGHHMQTFIGYPMRIATAALVRDGLTMAGVGSVGIDPRR